MKYTAPIAEKFTPDVMDVLLASTTCNIDMACRGDHGDEGEWDIHG